MQYITGQFNSVGVFQGTNTRSLMSERINITMHCDAFLMWASLTTTLPHTFQSMINIVFIDLYCRRLRHPLWSKFIPRDGNVMLINMAATVAWLWPKPYVIGNIFEGQCGRWASLPFIYVSASSRWEYPSMETAKCNSLLWHLISAFIINVSQLFEKNLYFYAGRHFVYLIFRIKERPSFSLTLTI